MYTIKLSELLAKNHGIDQRVAQRLGTMHYFLNHFRHEDYLQFLYYLRQYDSAESLILRLQNYLNNVEELSYRRSYRVASRRASQRIIVNWKDGLERKNDPNGHYAITLITSDNASYGLKFKRCAAHFLYLLILLFASHNRKLGKEYLRSKSCEIAVNDPLLMLANSIYGEDYGRKTIHSLAENSQQYFRELRKFILDQTDINDGERFWFVPQQDLNGNFSMPLACRSIIMDVSIKDFYDDVRKNKKLKPLDYNGVEYDNQKTVDCVIHQLSKSGNSEVTCDQIGQVAWDYRVVEALQWNAENDNTARNLLAQAEIQSLTADALNAFDLCQESAEGGDDQGQFLLAVYYMLGKHVEQNFVVAVSWLRKAADQGHADAIWLLGKCYFYGLGIEEDRSKAFTFYEKAAHFRSAGAARDAANCLMQGIGTDCNVLKAYEYLMIAADKDPVAQAFCKELMGSDWQRPLPENRVDDMVKLYYATDWQTLRHHFDPETQVGERELMELMYNFRRLGSNTKQERVLDLLDRFHYITGGKHWIEHVNEALYRGLSYGIGKMLEVVRTDQGEECRYEVVFNGNERLNDSNCNAKALIIYIIIAAFTKKKDGFTKTDVKVYKDICKKLWEKLDKKAGNSKEIEMLVNSYLKSENIRGIVNRYLPNYNNKELNPSINELLGQEAVFFLLSMPIRQRKQYYRIPEGTKIILPREIEDILNGTEQNRGQLSE